MNPDQVTVTGHRATVKPTSDDAVFSKLINVAVDELAATGDEHYYVNNYAAFVFCRHLMLVWDHETADGLMPCAKAFYEKCETHSDDREFHLIADEYDDLLPFNEFWLQAQQTWGSPRYGAGRSFQKALELARKLEPLQIIKHTCDPGLQVLAKVCKLLQAWAGEAPFFLSGVDAAKCFGKEEGGEKESKFGRRKLKNLCAYGVLKLISVGHTGRASEYRYILEEAVQDE